jgi:hypothetical protein
MSHAAASASSRTVSQAVREVRPVVLGWAQVVDRTGFQYYVYRVDERVINGQPITEEQVDAWVAEAEAGYDVEVLRKRGRPGRGAAPGQVIAVRLTEEEMASLASKAEAAHLNRSEAIRAALQAWCA